MLMQILVVDDELYMRRMLQMLCQRNGYQALLAANGQEGLDALRQAKPPVAAVLCDLVMAGMGGLQFLDQVLMDPKLSSTPVIIMTAGGTQEDLDAASLRGAAGTLIKPFSERQVVEQIEQALAGKGRKF